MKNGHSSVLHKNSLIVKLLCLNRNEEMRKRREEKKQITFQFSSIFHLSYLIHISEMDGKSVRIIIFIVAFSAERGKKMNGKIIFSVNCVSQLIFNWISNEFWTSGLTDSIQSDLIWWLIHKATKSKYFVPVNAFKISPTFKRV